MSFDPGKSLSACENLVRSHDRDRYFLSLATGRRAPELWPLFAFNQEIAKTREVVTEPQLGLIRLQWWRDALDAHYNGQPAPRHEVLDELTPLITAKKLKQDRFVTMLEAREADLADRPPATIAELVNYADRSATPLNRLALQVLEQEEDESAIRDISVAYALTGLIRAIPWHASQGRLYLPADLMEAQSLSLTDLQKQEAGPGLREIITALLDEADRRLKEKPGSRYMKATRQLALIYTRRLRRFGGNLRDERLQFPPAGFLLRILLSGNN